MEAPTINQTTNITGRRGSKLAAIALGAVLSLLLGSGLVAVASDTAQSTGNVARSSTYTPSTHDLVIAEIASGAGGDCGAGAYQQFAGAAITTASTNIDLTRGGRVEQANAPGGGFSDYCVKNAGTTAGRLTLQFTGVTDREILCSTDEAAGGGDLTCGNGGDGELRPMLLPEVSLGTESSDCTGLASAAFSTYEGGAQQLDAALAPGEACRIHLMLNISSVASDAAKLAAQSDEVSWTISFVLAG